MPWPGCMQSYSLACWDTTEKLRKASSETAAPGSHAEGPPVSPVEQHVGLHILYHCLMDLGDILVIEFIPLPIDHVLTVGNVVPT